MSPHQEPAGAERRIAAPPTMSVLAAEALRSMILSGELLPGDRLPENTLTAQLGVSRSPLREAMAVLEQEGLIVQAPRRGAIVRPLTAHDIYEIYTLRAELETLAVQLGVPVVEQSRLDRLRAAYADLEATTGVDQEEHTRHAFAFHLALVGLAGHSRIEETYRSLSLQMQLCMAMNRRARAGLESIAEDAVRHRPLLDLAVAGDRDGLLEVLRDHGQRTFLLDAEELLGGNSPQSEAWFAEVRAQLESSAQDAPDTPDDAPGQGA
ncbi:GntR family transcriptional regulator [Nocardioides sp. zg-1228]|uniref:GntR family transcriptional regulator n=1 Tax=Nocardioides sp. zg-1228 TaxID=2763008 RepID=UPI001642E2E6|nr:GntR family transcriptional regulator [Nocardioides sp. zg-1228]MBC2935144.1 GntR family transcriptional regulator [Nocardioides sp. zg-1228]QSF56985.1 GntR family transcriptional regulator [Nocardioides sp. zg-1228]